MKAVVAASSVFLAFASVAHSEPVYVRSGSSAGQGWVTRFGERCIVLTAAHVMTNDGGEVVGAGNVRGIVSRVHRDARYDLAVLEIEGALKTSCPQSGVGFRHSGPALEAARGGRRQIAVETAGRTGNPIVTPVRLDALDLSEEGTVDFVPLDGKADLALQGRSGAVVREMGDLGGTARQPLAIVVTVEDGVITAIRFDLARSLVERTFATAPISTNRTTQPARYELLSFSGDINSADCSPISILQVDARCDFVATASRGSSEVQLDVGLTTTTIVRRVRIQTTPGETFTIESASIDPRRGGQFLRVRDCTSASDGWADCSLAPRSAAALRLRFDRSVVIRSFDASGD